MPVPYDIHSRRNVKLIPITLQKGGADQGFVSDSESNFSQQIKELKRIALANGYGKIIQARAVTITTTPTLLKEHLGTDDRLLRIFNFDIVGGNTLLIDIDSQVSMGFPINTGDSINLIVVSNDRIWAKANAGTIDTRILEITNYPL